MLCNTHYRTKQQPHPIAHLYQTNMWLLPILVLLLGWSMPLTLSSKSAKLFKSPKLPIYETPYSYHDTSISSKTASTVKAPISSKRFFLTKKSASKSIKHEMSPTATRTDDTTTDELTDEPTYEPTSVVIIEENSVPTPEPTSSPETTAPTVSIIQES